MNEVDMLGLYHDIGNGLMLCETKGCANIAVDFIVQPLGTKDKISEEIVVPVCQECIDYLTSGEWVLLYCVRCLSSQWLNRSMARRIYTTSSVLWMDGCPDCKK
jgi:hypothetical protein